MEDGGISTSVGTEKPFAAIQRQSAKRRSSVCLLSVMVAPVSGLELADIPTHHEFRASARDRSQLKAQSLPSWSGQARADVSQRAFPCRKWQSPWSLRIEQSPGRASHGSTGCLRGALRPRTSSLSAATCLTAGGYGDGDGLPRKRVVQPPPSTKK